MVPFKEYANNSPLSGACVEYYFREDEDDGSKLIVKLVEEGLVPCVVSIPENSVDLSKLTLVNALWGVWEYKKDELCEAMFGALKRVRPLRLFVQMPAVKKTLEILESYCRDRMQSLFNAGL